jgi:hypothetical protein
VVFGGPKSEATTISKILSKNKAKPNFFRNEGHVRPTSSTMNDLVADLAMEKRVIPELPDVVNA